MSELALIRDELERASHGDPWHGASIKSILAGLTAAEASTHPIPGAHSIWEIVLHLTSWTREVTRRIRVGVAQQPEDGDWPEVGETTSAAWSRAETTLLAAHQSLVAALGDFPESRLPELVGTSRDAPLGSGVSYAVMLHGLAQHDAYHSGQISLLRKAVQEGPGRFTPGR